jgi:hypothetical protein
MPVLIKLVEIRGDKVILHIFIDENSAIPSRVELKKEESLSVSMIAEQILDRMMRNVKLVES